jgi:hypothetical protein
MPGHTLIGTASLTPEQKNASHTAMRSLEDIKKSLTSEQYQNICKGLQVPFTNKSPNSEIWRCMVFQSVMVGFTDRGNGKHREIEEYNGDECVDMDSDKLRSFDRVFLQSKLKTFKVNLHFRFVDGVELADFPPPDVQPVLEQKKVIIPVGDADDYQSSAIYKKMFAGAGSTFGINQGTRIMTIKKISDHYDATDWTRSGNSALEEYMEEMGYNQ